MRHDAPRTRYGDAAPIDTGSNQAIELAHAYARTFNGPDGQRVLADLEHEAMQPMVNASDPNALTAVGVQFKQRFVEYIRKQIGISEHQNKRISA